MSSSAILLLAGDIGGTNTRLILYEIDANEVNAVALGHKAPGRLIYNQSYQNELFNTFNDILTLFLTNSRSSSSSRSNKDMVIPYTACFACAGPVSHNKVVFTNRASWSIDGNTISKMYNIRKVTLINDFLAVGYGLLTLNEEEELVVLQRGKKDACAPIGCIGAGTGLGECFLTPISSSSSSSSGDSIEYKCYPCEGGHTDYTPRNELEYHMLQHLKLKFNQINRISVERIVSGSGLCNIYEYLLSIYPDKINQKLSEEYSNAGDLKGKIIASNYTNDYICRMTMDIFVTAYGSEAGSVGLKLLPYGGLYLTGGLTPKNIDLINAGDSGLFMTAFNDKGRVSHVLKDIPLYAVIVDDVGERGAHLVAYKDYVACHTSTKTSTSITSSSTYVLIAAAAFATGCSLMYILSNKRR